eukprot:gene433-1074_t
MVADVCAEVYPPTQMSYISMAVSCLLVIVTSMGNFLVIYAILKDPEQKLRTPFAFFLFNLTISDLAFGITAMPISIIYHIDEAKKQTLNTHFIVIVHMCYFISASASLFSMIAMCVDRYTALVSLTTHRRKISVSKYILISILIWLLAGAFSGFYFLLRYVTLLNIYIHVSLIGSFCITLVTYIRVLRNMKSLAKTLNKDLSRAERRRQKRLSRESRITKVFITVLVVYAAIYAPVFVFLYILQFCLSCGCDVRHIMRDMCFLLVAFTSASNPLVCIARMPTIRSTVIKAIRCNVRKVYEFSSHLSSINVPEDTCRQKSFYRADVTENRAAVDPSSAVKDQNVAEIRKSQNGVVNSDSLNTASFESSSLELQNEDVVIENEAVV